jgi:hypothetical protein
MRAGENAKDKLLLRPRQAIRGVALAFSILLGIALFFACRTQTLPPPNEIPEDYHGLFLAVIKSFGKRTYYIGSDAHWAYFQTKGEELLTPTYRKVEKWRLALPKTFPYAQETPYEIQQTNFAGVDFKR